MERDIVLDLLSEDRLEELLEGYPRFSELQKVALKRRLFLAKTLASSENRKVRDEVFKELANLLNL